MCNGSHGSTHDVGTSTEGPLSASLSIISVPACGSPNNSLNVWTNSFFRNDSPFDLLSFRIAALTANEDEFGPGPITVPF